MMRSPNQRAIEIVVALLKKHNIHYIVVSPGGTNIEFVKAVQDDPFFTLYSIVDERSAMYFAIGLYLQTGEIIATSCTSAQATRNYVPGLTEAYYKKVPILAITMQKHERFTGQEYMQAPNQSSLPSDCVKKSFVMPYINDVNNEYYGIRVANDAILELTHNEKGPVQLCIQWLDFNISERMPSSRAIHRFCSDNLPDLNFGNKKILIVVGEHRCFSKQETDSIQIFCDSHNCAVYVNHLSNYHGEYTVEANCLLTSLSLDLFVKEYKPDIIISIGGQTGDYPLYLILSKPELENTEHWRVCDDGNVVDTYDKLTNIFQCSINAFFSYYAGSNKCNHDYYKKFKELETSRKLDLKLPFSNAYAASVMHDRIPQNSIVQFSILNSLRVWNMFPIDPSVQCYCNVGAFGIDGGMSTFLGQSVVSENMCFLVIGDLAFYYDMNALGIRHIKNNVRILLVNNNGGVEFKQNYSNHTSVNRYIAAAGHFKNAKGWGETCGFKYLSAHSSDEFDGVLKEFLFPADKPIILEMFVKDSDDYKAYDLIRQHNQNLGLSDSIKKGIKRAIKR